MSGYLSTLETISNEPPPLSEYVLSHGRLGRSLAATRRYGRFRATIRSRASASTRLRKVKITLAGETT